MVKQDLALQNYYLINCFNDFKSQVIKFYQKENFESINIIESNLNEALHGHLHGKDQELQRMREIYAAKHE
jgi:hypothetical protein